jgi:peptidoglycan/LPS O-acetylase OafA/YrhL
MAETSTTRADSAAADGSEGQGGVPHRLQTHIAPLDGLRGWAAVMVVFAHVGFFGTRGPVDAQIGNYGVFLFFVLSGFLMGHLYLPKDLTPARLGTYLAARISRIVPLYYTLVIAGYLVGRFVDPEFTYAMSNIDLLRNLAFVGNTSVFWSIGPEFQFYFLFPVLWWIWRRPSPANLGWGVPVAFAVIVVLLFRASWPGIIVLSKIHIFLAGIFIATVRPRLVDAIDPRTVRIAQYGALLILLLLLLPREVVGNNIYPLTKLDVKHNLYYQDFGKLFALSFVVFAFTFETRFANALFANRLMTLLGKYSFSIYLLHVPLLYVAERIGLFGRLSVWVAFPIVLVVLLGICALSFRLLEEPLRVASGRTAPQRRG